MTAKEFLSRAYLLDQQINSKLEQISALRDLVFKITSNCSDERVSGTKDHTKMENIIAKMVDLESEIDNDIDRLVDVKREITEAISLVENPAHRLILEQRYILCKTWEDIACYLGYDVSNIYKIHKRILRNFKNGE